jgi:autotransporter-associated beta strand protein
MRISVIRAIVAAAGVTIIPSPAHCQLNPNSFASIGAVSAPSDVLGGNNFNTDTLTATFGGTTYQGVTYAQPGGPPIAVFDFSSFSVGGGFIFATGSRPLAVLSRGDISMSNTSAVFGAGLGASAAAGVGGYSGGSAIVQNPNTSGIDVEPGAGPGGGGAAFTFGAGGGGYGGVGGSGGGTSSGNIPAGGISYGGLPQILQGGSGGGATANSALPIYGGGGGGAVEFAAIGNVNISGVDASGGQFGGGSNGNAGGGSGGAILISAGGSISIGSLTANGGQGTGSTALSAGGGGGGGRIMIAGNTTYGFGSQPTNIIADIEVSGGTGSIGPNFGSAGVVTVDAQTTDIPGTVSVILDGTPLSSVSSTSRTTPNIMAYIRHNLALAPSSTATLGANNALFTTPGIYTANLTISGGTFNLNGFSQSINQLNGGSTDGFHPAFVQIPAGSTLTVGNGDGSGALAGQFAQITGGGAFVKTGAGTQTLGGTCPFSGSTTVVGGVLALANDNALPNSTITLAGGTLSFPSPAANPAIGGLAGTSDLALTGITSLSVGFNNASTDYSGTLSGTAALVKIGAGALTLGGTLLSGNFTGTTTLNTGVLALANDLVLANSTVTLNGGSLLFTTGAVNPTLGGLSGSNNLALTGINSLTVGANSSSTTYSGLLSGTAALVKAGTGTLTLTGASTQYASQVTVAAGTLAIGNDSALSNATVNLAGGNLSFTTTTPVFGALAGSSNLSLAGLIAFTAGGNNASTTYSGNLSGSVSNGLEKTGAGTWSLTGTNTQTARFAVFAGTVLIGSAGALAANNWLTVSTGSTLDLNGYSYTMTSGTTLNIGGTLRLGGGSITVAPGVIANYTGATVMNGTIRGAGNGNQAVNGGTFMTGVTTTNDTVLGVSGAATFQNFSNGGSFNVAAVAAGNPLPVAFDGFTNQGSGSITVSAVSNVSAGDFQSYGTLTINPATVGSGQFTELINTGASPLFFNGGSRTFLGTPATANQNGQPTFVAGIDLHGQNAVVAGGLFVNNGFVVDSSNGGAGTATIIADYGSLVKGAGFFQNPIITQNGGRVQAGNSPGVASFGRFVFGPGGVSNYVFAIDDAAGTAGPSPDALGHVSGWGFIKTLRQSVGSLTTSGDFTWTATPTDKLTVAIDTLVNPTTVGMDVAGPMADFDSSHSYSWQAAHWAGDYSGPTDSTTLNAATTFDSASFLNPIAGSFGWQLDPAGQTLSLVYTPTAVPEPGTLALLGAAAAGWLVRQRFFSRSRT